MKTCSFQLNVLRLWISAVLIAALTGASAAATFTVPGDYASIQAAIESVPDGATVLVSSGTYGFINAENLNKTLYIKAVDGPGSTFVDGGGSNPLLRIENAIGYGEPNKYITFDGFTFRNGAGAGVQNTSVLLVSTRAVFLNCAFSNNVSSTGGGAVLIYGQGGAPRFVDCSFANNRTDFRGGAVLAAGNYTKTTFKRCTFTGNTTRTPLSNNLNQGGALMVDEAEVVIEDCHFENNSANYAGGAVMLLNSLYSPSYQRVAEHVITGSTFVNNSAEYLAGRPPAQGGDSGQAPPTEAGAVMVEQWVDVTLRGCRFENNQANSGGAVMVYRGELLLEHSVFEGNVADGNHPSTGGGGGGLGVSAVHGDSANNRLSTVTVKDCLFRNNSSHNGGAIATQGNPVFGFTAANRSTVNLTDVVLEGNIAPDTVVSTSGYGGGMYVNLTALNANRIYVLNNHADKIGGGWLITGNAAMNVDNSYVVGNSADVSGHYEGRGFYAGIQNDPASLFNTVVDYNGGSGTASTPVLKLMAIPDRSFGPEAFLTYLKIPYENSTIQPGGFEPLDRGGFSAGSLHVSNLTQSQVYELQANAENDPATVTHAYRGLDSRAWGGIPPQVPARLEAEHYDVSALGLTYIDRTDSNDGGALRPSEGVDIAPQAEASNGHVVGYLYAGEYMEYSVKSPGGAFIPEIRYTAPAIGGKFYLSVNGVQATEVIALPSSGGWTSFATLETAAITVPAGFADIRMVCVDQGFNVDYIQLKSIGPRLGVSPPILSRTVLPGTSAEDVTLNVFNMGGDTLTFTLSESAAWFSLTPTSGSSSGEPVPVQVAFDTTGLGIGSHHETITITSTEADNSPFTVDVWLHLLPGKTLKNDFDGDGRSDLGVYYPPTGDWFLYRSNEGFMKDTFGFSGTLPVTGDFDGDGLSDRGYYHPPTGEWYFKTSTLGVRQARLGFLGTKPVVGDFDGDGVYDYGIYHPPTGSWNLQQTRDGNNTFQFGFDGTLPVVGDLDGDGKDDVGVYYPPLGGWYFYTSTEGFRTFNFGFDGTVPVVGDLDGDGKDDVGCYYAPLGLWFFFQSTEGFLSFQFGFDGTTPVVVDFDGDGRDDVGCYYPPLGLWFIFMSTDGFQQYQFGFDGTVPVN